MIFYICCSFWVVSFHWFDTVDWEFVEISHLHSRWFLLGDCGEPTLTHGKCLWQIDEDFALDAIGFDQLLASLVSLMPNWLVAGKTSWTLMPSSHRATKSQLSRS